jgi:lysyl-tRNA synthetase class 2
VAVLGAAERRLDVYAECGLRALYHGDEAVIDVARFSLEGRSVRKVRQAVHRLERAGYQADIRYARDVDPAMRSELESILREWRGREPQKGFVMALDSLDRLQGEDAIFAIGRQRGGAPMGFLHFVVVRAGAALSLSSMPRRPGTPNGFNEWLIAQALRWAGSRRFRTMSLNFSPFAAILSPQSELSPAQRLERHALLAVKSRFGFQLDNLLLFTGQFQPRWERRYVLYERWSDLPRVGVAALRAEGYLPFGAGRVIRDLPRAS